MQDCLLKFELCILYALLNVFGNQVEKFARYGMS